jgi:hypothetical protein
MPWTPGVIVRNEGDLGHVDIDFWIGDGIGVIPTGRASAIRIPFAINLTGWTIVEVTGTTGSIVVDFWRASGYENYPPTVANTIAGTEKPTLSSAQKNQDLSLGSFTTALKKDDWLVPNVDSASSVKAVLITLHGIRA